MLINGIIISLLFLLSLIVPLISFVLPVYKISKIDKLPTQKILWSNVLAMAIISGFNWHVLLVYLFFFIPIEFMYLFFNKKVFDNFKEFDKIIIVAFMITIIITIAAFLTKVQLIQQFHIIMNLYRENFGFTPTQISDIWIMINQNWLLYIFSYSMIIVYFMYSILDFKSYLNWDISFGWLLLYIIPFLVIRVIHINNFYISNTMRIGEVIFMFYGIKSMFKFLSKYIKYRFLKDFISFGIAVVMPFSAFLIGVIGAFWQEQEDKIENK